MRSRRCCSLLHHCLLFTVCSFLHCLLFSGVRVSQFGGRTSGFVCRNFGALVDRRNRSSSNPVQTFQTFDACFEGKTKRHVPLKRGMTPKFPDQICFVLFAAPATRKAYAAPGIRGLFCRLARQVCSQTRSAENVVLPLLTILRRLHPNESCKHGLASS